MNGDNIVPYVSPEARRAVDDTKKLVQDLQQSAEDRGSIEAIENILRALEGMQAQVGALTDLVIEQDKRIEKLERRKIIRGIGS
jgi:hypothetical protein